MSVRDGNMNTYAPGGGWPACMKTQPTCNLGRDSQPAYPASKQCGQCLGWFCADHLNDHTADCDRLKAFYAPDTMNQPDPNQGYQP